MFNESHDFAFLISVNDFDKSLLPPHARTPGTEAFSKAVTKAIEQDYKPFGGRVQIRVDDQTIQVQWHGDPDSPHPLDAAVRKLTSGDYDGGVRLLEVLRRQQPDHPEVLYNLGMALSDMGKLDEAIKHLRHAVAVEPTHNNARVAVGVALARQRKYDEAVTVLKEAVEHDPENPWAHRNLGACLLQAGRGDDAEHHLGRAVELNPADQQAVLGHAQALHGLGREKEADDLYVRVISMNGRSPMADVARDARSKLAQGSFRERAPGGVRPDAVMYLLGAMQKFDKMTREEVQKVAFEIAIIGQRGLDTNDPAQKYSLKSLPGNYSGLHMVCMMYVGFRKIAPEHSIGFDLSKEYETAMSMHRGGNER